MAAAFLGIVFSGTFLEISRRQIFRLAKAAELTFTVNICL